MVKKKRVREFDPEIMKEKKDIQKKLMDRLEDGRYNKNIKQIEAATEIGLQSASAYNNLITGKTQSLDFSSVVLLCKRFEIDFEISDFF